MKNSEPIPGRWRQTIASIVVNLPSYVGGLSYGWTSTMLPLLQKYPNPTDIEPLSDSQVGWSVLGMALGPLFIIPFCASFCEKFGRRGTGLAVAIPIAVCWLLRLFGSNFYLILAAQALGGVGDAVSTFFVPLYITEMVSDDIRGHLGCFMVFSFQVGVLTGYGLGSFLDYHAFTIVGLVLPIFHFGGLFLLPETPVYLFRKNRMEETRKSLMWFRGNDAAVVEAEMARLKDFTELPSHEKKVTMKNVIKHRGIMKGMIIALLLILGQQLSGINTVMAYTVMIFERAHSSVDPNVASIVFGVMQVVGVWLSTITNERTGRRPLLLISAAGMALCHFALALFVLLQEQGSDVSNFKWVPIVALSTFGVAYNVGMGPIPFIVSNEMYHPEIASVCNTLSMFVLFSGASIVMELFPIILNSIGLHYCFFILLCFCTCTFFFTLFVVPETRGRPIECILEELNKSSKKSENTSEKIIEKWAATQT